MNISSNYIFREGKKKFDGPSNKPEPFYVQISYSKKSQIRSQLQNGVAETSAELKKLRTSHWGKFELDMIEDIVSIESNGFKSPIPERQLNIRLRPYLYSIQEKIAMYCINSVREFWIHEFQNGDEMTDLLKEVDIMKDIYHSMPHDGFIEGIKEGKFDKKCLEPYIEIIEKARRVRDKADAAGLIKRNTNKKIREALKFKEKNRLRKRKEDLLNKPLPFFNKLYGVMHTLKSKSDDPMIAKDYELFEYYFGLIKLVDDFEKKYEIFHIENNLWNWHYGNLKSKFHQYLKLSLSIKPIHRSLLDNPIPLAFSLIPSGYDHKSKFTHYLLSNSENGEFLKW